MVNKKVKWSIISISTASVLAFGGLVVQNNKVTGSSRNTNLNNNVSNGFSDNSNNSNTDGNSSEWDLNQNEEDSNWDQDEFRQAPDQGFEQGHGSSGASR